VAKAHSTQPIPPFPADLDRVAFGHWLSGFVDGDGTLLLFVVQQKGRPPSCMTRRAEFRITLRDDDAGILRLIQSYWGCGHVTFNHNRRSKCGAKPVCLYYVTKADDLANVVLPHFATCPLRSKKARDLVLWKRGIELIHSVYQRPLCYRPGHQANRHGGTFPKWTETEAAEFQSLWERLKLQRVYAASAVPLPPRSMSHPRRPERGLFDSP
jgi:hypothetical protein